MELDSQIKTAITVGAQKTRYDAACKQILSNKHILAWILKSCVEEYQHCSINDIATKYIEGEPLIDTVAIDTDLSNRGSTPTIRGVNSEDSTQTEGLIKYDILFNAVTPNGKTAMELIINIEAQNKFHPGYSILKRSLYYVSRLISAQKEKYWTGSDYDRIRKVYSIWICMNPPNCRQNTINKYSFTEECLYGSYQESKSQYDLANVFIICIGGNMVQEPVLDLLNVLFSDKATAAEKIETLKAYEVPVTEIERSVADMCNLSEGVYYRGIEKGRKEAMEEATLLVSVNHIKALMENNMSFTDACNLLNITDPLRDQCLRLMNIQ